MKCPKHIICDCKLKAAEEAIKANDSIYTQIGRLVPDMENGMHMGDALALILKELKRLNAIIDEGKRA